MPPAIGVGVVAIANLGLVLAVVHVRPGKVVEHPYASGEREDARLAALHAFAGRGWRIEAAVDAGGATLRLIPGSGPGAAVGTVHAYRPDDPALDRDQAWADPAQTLRVVLPRAGAWRLSTQLRDRDGGLLAAELEVARP